MYILDRSLFFSFSLKKNKNEQNTRMSLGELHSAGELPYSEFSATRVISLKTQTCWEKLKAANPRKPLQAHH